MPWELTHLSPCAQTCKMAILADDLDKPEQLGDEWHRVAALFAYEFSKLAPGEHRVEVNLHFRLAAQDSNLFTHPSNPKRCFPWRSSPLSAPLASGQFTLVVPTTKVVRRSILPRPLTPALGGTPAPERARLEELLMEHMGRLRDWGARSPKREVPIHMVVTSEPYVSSTEVFIMGYDGRGCALVSKEPTAMSRSFYAVFRRRKADGWPRETFAVFDLSASGSHQRNPPSTWPPICGIAVGRSFEVDAELLSEEDALKCPK